MRALALYPPPPAPANSLFFNPPPLLLSQAHVPGSLLGASLELSSQSIFFFSERVPISSIFHLTQMSFAKFIQHMARQNPAMYFSTRSHLLCIPVLTDVIISIPFLLSIYKVSMH